MSVEQHNRFRYRHLLTLKNFRKHEIESLIDLAVELKQAKKEGLEFKRLRNKEIALIFEKDSTRTRAGFEVAAHDQGAHVTYLGPTGSQIGYKESIKDTARVLGRMYDGIEYRGFDQSAVEDLARFAGVPVYNGLTDKFHPTQILADLLTMSEHVDKPWSDISFCFIGDAGNNMGNSLLTTAAIMGMDARLCAPKACWPESKIIEDAQALAKSSGARLSITENVHEAVADSDFIYTDVWLSMGESEDQWGDRINLLKPYQVNSELMTASGNPDIRFMHCLPAFHNTDTVVGKKIADQFGIDCMEVTDDVFESPASIVFDQAENRMHTIKAVLVSTLADKT